MHKIYDNREYRIKYETLVMASEILKEVHSATWITENPKIQELKRELREYAHRKSDRRYLANISDDSYYTVIITLPDYITNYEDADEYFKEYEYMTCRPSQYDCTGQHFTRWYKIFKRNGRYMAFHKCGVDI